MIACSAAAERDPLQKSAVSQAPHMAVEGNMTQLERTQRDKQVKSVQTV
jgi:hypothetical protein